MYPVTLVSWRQRLSAACGPHIATSIAVAVSSKSQPRAEKSCIGLLTQKAMKDDKPSARDITSCTVVALLLWERRSVGSSPMQSSNQPKISMLRAVYEVKLFSKSGEAVVVGSMTICR
jgi:hypothetical protein